MSTTETITYPHTGGERALCMRYLCTAETIANNPALYNLTAGDAAKLQPHAHALDEALHLTDSPSTRTTPNIQAKDTIAKAANAVFREYINRIKDDATISKLDKLDLGFKITRKRAITAIHTAPLLHISHIDSDGCHILHYADEKTPSKRAKPPGVDHLELQIIIAAQTAPAPSPATGAGGPGAVGERAGVREIRTERIKRNPARIEHDPKNAGQTATYFAHWSTTTSRNNNPITGRWSMPVAMTVGFSQNLKRETK